MALPPALRPVDHAMIEDRPEKTAIRKLWVQRTSDYVQFCASDDDLLYLTLPGAEGRDIAELARANVISLTEVGGIEQNFAKKIAAVENNSEAVRSLQRRYPGLKIYEAPFKNLVRGEGLLAFPVGEDRRLCRARIVNLDINSPLHARFEGGALLFPILNWIRKLGQIHTNPQRTSWCLFLTLHADLPWDNNICSNIRRYMADNLANVEDFAESARQFAGNSLVNKISAGQGKQFAELSRSDRQKFLMIFVPKKLIDLLRDQGWRIKTHANLRYGASSRAPMITMIFEFLEDERAANEPNFMYRHNLLNILSAAGRIKVNDEIVYDD